MAAIQKKKEEDAENGVTTTTTTAEPARKKRSRFDQVPEEETPGRPSGMEWDLYIWVLLFV